MSAFRPTDFQDDSATDTLRAGMQETLSPAYRSEGVEVEATFTILQSVRGHFEGVCVSGHQKWPRRGADCLATLHTEPYRNRLV